MHSKKVIILAIGKQFCSRITKNSTAMKPATARKLPGKV